MNKKALSFMGMILVAALAAGCASEERKDRDFFTSGNREADQRAEQRIAKEQQLRGEGEGQGQPEAKKTLYERLGGEAGMQKIVDDFVVRALADPRVNWERKGIEKGGWSLNRNKSVEWKSSPDSLARMKKHITQFLTLATGGPAKYEGRDMKEVHAGLHITNAEFDAAVGDLKASLDKLGIATEEQKDLLAVIESTRPQVVAER